MSNWWMPADAPDLFALLSLRRKRPYGRTAMKRHELGATSLDHLVGAGACNGGMIPRFHRAVCDYFTFGSAPVPAITRAEKPVLNDSKFSPFPFRHCTCKWTAT
jgi:hypothetical protein